MERLKQRLKAFKNSPWIFTTYFAEGLPFQVAGDLANTYFVAMGMSLETFGLTSIYNFAWSLKFLWAPAIDLFKTRRFWILCMEALLSAACIFLTLSTFTLSPIYYGAILFGVMALLSATHDIAIDGFYLEQLNETEQRFYSGFRTMAYRIAMLFVSAVLVGVAGLWGWKASFGITALIMISIFITHLIILPASKTDHTHSAKKSTAANFVEAFSSYLKQERIIVILAFLILYVVGNQMTLKMAKPFLMREIGITITQMAIISGTIGKIFSIIGAILGGIFIAKVGLKIGLWVLTLVQSMAVLLYIMLAVFKPCIYWVAAVHAFETTAASLSLVALVNYIMFTCKKDFKASHYAIGSGLTMLGGSIASMLSGYVAARIGYVNFFTLSLICCVPGIILMFFLPFEQKN
jgi:PAT family beta-lactamase induction signal transducer AmpG